MRTGVGTSSRTRNLNAGFKVMSGIERRKEGSQESQNRHSRDRPIYLSLEAGAMQGNTFS